MAKVEKDYANIMEKSEWISQHPMISVREAVHKIVAAANNPLGTIQVLVKNSLGYVLSEDVKSPMNIPQVPTSVMDGFAVNSSVFLKKKHPILNVSSAAFAGIPQKERDVESVGGDVDGDCVYVTTGAPIPVGYDSVQQVEQCVSYDHIRQTTKASAASTIKVLATTVEGQFVRSVGSDVSKDEVVLPRSHTLSHSDLSLLTSIGVRTVCVYVCPTVGVLSTGDEVVQTHMHNTHIGEGITDGSVYDSNQPLLESLLNALSPAPETTLYPCVKDDEVMLLCVVFKSVVDNDISIITGGVSMGDHDHCKSVLSALGHLLFGRLHMKPGKPATVAEIDMYSLLPNFLAALTKLLGVVSEADLDLTPYESLIKSYNVLMVRHRHRNTTTTTNTESTPATKPAFTRLVFALPGNPVSAYVCYHLLVYPAVNALSQRHHDVCSLPRVRAVLSHGVKTDPERPEFHRMTVRWCDQHTLNKPGYFTASSTGAQNSCRLLSVYGSNALAFIHHDNLDYDGNANLDCGSVDVVNTHTKGMLRAGTVVDVWLTDTRDLNRHVAVVDRSAQIAKKKQVLCGCSHTEPTTISTTTTTTTSVATTPVATTQVNPHTVPHSLNESGMNVDVCVLTISSSCFQRINQDKSGPTVVEILQEYNSTKRQIFRNMTVSIVPDDFDTIVTVLVVASMIGTPQDDLISAIHSKVICVSKQPDGRFVLYHHNKLICSVFALVDMKQALQRVIHDQGFTCSPVPSLLLTTGGTGFSPSDVTPEASLAVFCKQASGLTQFMMSTSLTHTPLAALSRAVAGIVLSSLVLNLPGSPKAVKEILPSVLTVIPHALKLILNGQ